MFVSSFPACPFLASIWSNCTNLLTTHWAPRAPWILCANLDYSCPHCGKVFFHLFSCKTPIHSKPRSNYTFSGNLHWVIQEERVILSSVLLHNFVYKHNGNQFLMIILIWPLECKTIITRTTAVIINIYEVLSICEALCGGLYVAYLI